MGLVALHEQLLDAMEFFELAANCAGPVVIDIIEHWPTAPSGSLPLRYDLDSGTRWCVDLSEVLGGLPYTG